MEYLCFVLPCLQFRLRVVFGFGAAPPLVLALEVGLRVVLEVGQVVVRGFQILFVRVVLVFEVGRVADFLIVRVVSSILRFVG